MSGIELNDTTDLHRFAYEWTRWTPSDSVRHHPDGSTTVVPGGWNHDHCIECHARFSDYGKDLRLGYRNDDANIWLCTDCYEKYVAPYL